VLLSLRFANHRSFRDEQQLNLLPVYDADSEAPLDAVKVVGIFGANESGRSNVRKLADIVAPTALFLSVAARFDFQKTTEGNREAFNLAI
jgi:ABC-type antimicrobial peptide transport system ATPase subunit